MKKIILKLRTFGVLSGLLFLCSCATTPRPSAVLSVSELPADVAINKNAGHGHWIYLTLHFENGKELLFAVDTGMPFTVLDKSLEPILGKRLGTRKFSYAWFGKVTTGVYEAPKLFLGNTQLLTGDRVYTDDLSRMPSDRPLMGFLGTDCLRHYCIQLDFDAGKMRFLEPEQTQNINLGEKYPLTFSGGTPLIHANLFGRPNAYFIVDTGCTIDAALKPKLFQQEVQGLRERAVQVAWQTKTSAGVPVHEVLFPEVKFNSETLTNFILSDCPDLNLLGLRFLARHLTTLNYPKQTMYLQRRSDEHFAKEDGITSDSDYASTMEADKFLSNLKGQGQLPGWLRDERGQVSVWTPNEHSSKTHPISRTFVATKKNDIFKYHYLVVQVSEDSAWKLQKAWQTDQNGHTTEEYPVP